MDAFDHKFYVPVLLTKAGEQDALSALSSADKAALAPLLVIHPIDWDFDKDQPSKGVDAHLSKLPGNLVKSWGTRPAFLDATYVETEVMADGSHPIEWVTSEAASRGLQLVPTLAPENSADYRAAVARLLAVDEDSELCLRLQVGAWPLAPSTAVDQLLSELGVVPERTHLVLDLRDQTSASALMLTQQALPRLLHLTRWKTITLAATAMPQALPSEKAVHEIDRTEWSNYLAVKAANGGWRMPTFGDFGIAHPDPMAATDPRLMQISAKFKYTTDSKWLVGRGELFKGHGGRSGGGAAIQPVARGIVAHADFTSSHCDGEVWLTDAAGNRETGAPRTWLKFGTQHHIKRVLDQVSAL